MGDNTDATTSASDLTYTINTEEVSVTIVSGNTEDEIQDKNKKDEEEEKEEEDKTPKFPSTDPYYVVMSVVLGIALVGVLVYFAVSSALEEPKVLDLTIFAKFYNVSYSDQDLFTTTTVYITTGAVTDNTTANYSMSTMDEYTTTLTPPIGG